MPIYHLEGYNSGGYKDKRKIDFAGEIEKFTKQANDADFPLMKEWWFRYTDADGIHEDQGERMQTLIDEACGWRESFYVTSIEKEEA